MIAALPRTGEQSPDAAAGRLLAALAEQAVAAHALVTAGEAESLVDLLESRRLMLEELDRTVHALGAEKQRAAMSRTSLTVHRERLLTMTREVEVANNKLLDVAKAECVRIAATMRGLDSPDGVASAYGAAGTPSRRLDLVR